MRIYQDQLSAVLVLDTAMSSQAVDLKGDSARKNMTKLSAQVTIPQNAFIADAALSRLTRDYVPNTKLK